MRLALCMHTPITYMFFIFIAQKRQDESVGLLPSLSLCTYSPRKRNDEMSAQGFELIVIVDMISENFNTIIFLESLRKGYIE